MNNSLKILLEDKMKLAPTKYTKKGSLSWDKSVLEDFEAHLKPNSKPYIFIKSLRRSRKRATNLTYLEAYRRFGLSHIPGFILLHPNLNPTGTDTLRWSSNNPNSQNVSKQALMEEGRLGRTLRYTFGPAPGREWWSMDAKNIELRIPAYEAGELDMIALFETPDEPPYYGSNHLLNFHTVYPDIWEKVEREVGFEKVGSVCKSRFADSWYQWCKNGGFAVQYGAVDRGDIEGTADRAFHRRGSHAKLKQRFQKIHGPGGLNERLIAFANEHGYVETIPDKLVDPDHGYPLMCARGWGGDVKPTIPLNYRTQGTAMWWMMTSMIGCHEYLAGYEGYYMIMQVHDELVFDFPAGTGKEPWRTNYKIADKCRRIMESSGDRIGIPTPVSMKYHDHNWQDEINPTTAA